MLTANGLAAAAAIGYGAASAAYLINFMQRRQESGISSAILYVSLILHTAWVVFEHIQSGYFPIATAHYGLSFVAWALALAYVVIELWQGRRGFGPFIVPVVFLGQAVAAVFILTRPHPGPLPEILQSVWFEVHAGSALFSYCAFAVAFAAGLMYILLFHEIRLKRLGFFFMRMPPLETLERINYQAIALGFLFLTIGIGSGVIWVMEPRAVRIPVDAKMVSAIFVWLLYAANLHARLRRGWRGQRTAIFSIANFALLIAVFCLTSLVLGAHDFLK